MARFAGSRYKRGAESTGFDSGGPDQFAGLARSAHAGPTGAFSTAGVAGPARKRNLRGANLVDRPKKCHKTKMAMAKDCV